MNFFSRLVSSTGSLLPSRGSRFSRQAQVYAVRLENEWRRVSFPALPEESPALGLFLTPWGTTAVPFFTAELALQLRLAGHPVALIVDCANICGNAADKEEVAIIRQLASRLAQHLPVSEVWPEDGEAEISVEGLVFEDCVRQARCEEGARALSAAGPERGAAYRRAAAGAIRGLRTRTWNRLILPGGLWALSGVYAASAEKLGIPFLTFDSGYSCLAISRGGAAAHFPDFAEAFAKAREVVEEDPAMRARVLAGAAKLLDTRRQGDDEYRLQPQGNPRLEESFQVVAPLNFRVDTAAMQRGLAFPDVNAWLRALVDWAAGQDGMRLAIRQHPCEKIPKFRSKEDYSWIARAAPGKVTFISAEAPVNTYDLFDSCRVVLPYTSRSGLDAALMGRHVIVGTKVYYSGCEFIETARTPAEYFHKIEAALHRDPPQYPPIERALAYFLAERCMLARTEFTPMPADLGKWMKLSPGNLARLPSTQALLRGLPEGRNFLLDRFMEIMESGQ
jgi:hypothetical protein